MTNLCKEAGCEASCCFGSYFIFSDQQYLLWMSLAGDPAVDNLNYDSFQKVANLTDRRDGTGLILHSVVVVEDDVKHFVKVDGKCPLLQKDFSCFGWGQIDACNRLLRASKRCDGFRKRDKLLPVDRSFKE